MNLRKYAKGKDCKVRIPGYCNGNPETTVLAHIRLSGITGTGLKSPDIQAAHCCSACHDVVDGRVQTGWTEMEIRCAFYEGVMRTQYELIKEGKVTWD